MKVIGLVGPKRAGKTTAAQALVRERGFVSVGFADALKELALKVNPIIHPSGIPLEPHAQRLAWWVERYGWEYAKKRPHVRRFLQELGTGVRDIVGPDSWIDAWFERMVEARRAGATGVVVPDVRFLNEAQQIRDEGGLLIRITRPELDTSDQHISETDQLGIECDYEITNDGDRIAFQVDVVNAVTTWMASTP